MPGSADAVQRAIHALEAGGAAIWVRRALVLALLVGLSLFYLLHEFRGLATSQAMDQAQIGLYGIQEEQGVAANQLHLLFVPIMTCFGLAFLLVQWNRLGIAGRLPRLGFLTLLFVLCAGPMISNLLLASAKGDEVVGRSDQSEVSDADQRRPE